MIQYTYYLLYIYIYIDWALLSVDLLYFIFMDFMEKSFQISHTIMPCNGGGWGYTLYILYSSKKKKIWLAWGYTLFIQRKKGHTAHTFVSRSAHSRRSRMGIKLGGNELFIRHHLFLNTPDPLRLSYILALFYLTSTCIYVHI